MNQNLVAVSDMYWDGRRALIWYGGRTLDKHYTEIYQLVIDA